MREQMHLGDGEWVERRGARSPTKGTGAFEHLHEQWRPCPGFESLYEVSNQGRVRRHQDAPRQAGTWPKRLLNPGKRRSDGRLRVTLNNGRGQQKKKLVAALVCRAFHGEPVSGDLVASHIDGNILHVAAANLQWMMPGDVLTKAHKQGRRPQRGKVLTSLEAEAIYARYGLDSAAVLSAEYGVSVRTIHDIWNGTTHRDADERDDV